ncbi:molecular chaperone Tir [Tenacibaculum discolor]|uniref:Molecular chaperone Tir n=1 Tax=Tenacibaculum discolor TaxID=361581 RepID=A0A2G1BY03_9FLAO|nr:TIR domain-containing protein [Tenacibaculum discolor]MDP2541168.1 TIR domain-containing protein [Tenacibaculum discolor]PHN98878.1 molecular chaperone Tir [Tenacibaculum discolor]PHO01547.1 molecular chaperone Tir [Rhodobacteraceae bacterium 4F10]
MPKRKVFYSFHYKNDVFRVQQIRNMGVIEGNSPVTPNQWETIKQTGKKAVEKWISENLKNKSCVVVLIGSETSKREWVLHEIEQAWNSGKPVLGIYIHNLKCPISGKSTKGSNPFDLFTMKDSNDKLSKYVKCYNPKTYDAYNDIKTNIDSWIEEAIKSR